MGTLNPAFILLLSVSYSPGQPAQTKAIEEDVEIRGHAHQPRTTTHAPLADYYYLLP